MAKAYTREEILEKCMVACEEKVESLYSQPFINYRGQTKEVCGSGREFYTEIIAKYILDNIHLLDNIGEKSREGSYTNNTHLGYYDSSSNRQEEHIAMDLVRQCATEQFPSIGKIVDYQIPLKSQHVDAEQNEGLGKIDLLAVNTSKRIVYILELKRPKALGDKFTEETMLRCVLESETYRRIVDKKKLLKDFSVLVGADLSDYEVKAAPIVFYGCGQYKEMQGGHPELYKLMEVLDIHPFYIKWDDVNQKYIEIIE